MQFLMVRFSEKLKEIPFFFSECQGYNFHDAMENGQKTLANSTKSNKLFLS